MENNQYRFGLVFFVSTLIIVIAYWAGWKDSERNLLSEARRNRKIEYYLDSDLEKQWRWINESTNTTTTTKSN